MLGRTGIRRDSEEAKYTKNYKGQDVVDRHDL